jgi:hypothetical protein
VTVEYLYQPIVDFHSVLDVRVDDDHDEISLSVHHLVNGATVDFWEGGVSLAVNPRLDALLRHHAIRSWEINTEK